MKISQQKRVIFVAALSQLCMQFVANMATIIMPEIAMELHISSKMQMWINLTFLCSFLAIAIPLGKVISYKGVKKSVILTYLLLIVSLLFCGLSTNFIMVLIGRLIQGICCASLGMSIYIMLVEELDEVTLGSALGLVGSCGYVGLTMAPSITGFVTSFFGWRSAFLLIIPVFIIQLAVLYSIKTEWTREKTPFDRKGALLYCLMMVLFTIGLTELDSSYAVLLLFSLILLPIFIRYEKRQNYPVLNISLFKNMEMSIGFYAAVAAHFSTSIAITVLTFHLTYPMDMDTSTVGIIMLITPLTMIVTSLLAGKLSGKKDPIKITGCALVIIFIAMFIFSYLGFIPLELIIAACIIQGIGHGFFSSPNNKHVLTLAEDDDISDASALLSTSKEFGKILSTGIYALLFSVFLNGVVLGPQKYDARLIYTNHIMITVTCIVTLSAAALLFYCMLRYDKHILPEHHVFASRIKQASIRREERLKKRREKLERLKSNVQKREEHIKQRHEQRKNIKKRN